MISNLPVNVLAAVPDALRSKIQRASFICQTVAWRNAASGAGNAGVLGANQFNSDSVLQVDGSGAFVATSARIQPSDANDVYSSTASILVEKMTIDGGEGLVSQPTYASLLFDNASNASDLPEWPVGIYIPPKGTLTVTLTNLEAVARDVQIAFWGYRLIF